MSEKYLVRFTPREPYFFGGENTFRTGDTSRYYISSLTEPSASTLIGVLRYVLLEQNGLLKTNGKYSPAEKAACDELIGPSSFTVGKKNSFGKLKSISPLFLTCGSDFYIKTPLNCRASGVGKAYEPFAMSDEAVFTSFGKKMRFPLKDEYKCKNPVSGESFMSLSDRSIIDELFLRTERVGIAKKLKENGFFKKEYCLLKEGFSFAVVIELEDGVKLGDGLCYMGREKSAFSLSVEKTELNIEKLICECLAKASDDEFYYVFGDTFVEETFEYTDFAMIRTDVIRMLSTKTEKDTLKITCCNEFYQVLKAGGVMYANDITVSGDTEYGFNKIVKVEK